MSPTFYRNRSTWLAYIFLAFYGYYLNILGPITPFLMDDLKISYTFSSLHFTAFALGMLVAGLGGHILAGRIGRWPSLWIGAFGMSLSALLLLAGRTPLLTIGASFIMGTVGSLILSIVPSVLSDQYGEQRAIALSEANVISSLVSTIAPLMVGWFAASAGGWRLSLAIAAIAPLIIRLVFWKVSSSPATSFPTTSTHVSQPLPLLYWVYWVAIVLAVSIEFCMIFWSADYMEKVLGMARANAAQAVGLFLGAMIIGRLAGSRLVQRFTTYKLVTSSILLSGAGFMVYWMSGNALAGMVGLFITGLGVGALYPLILSLAIGVAGKNTVQASTRATLASGSAILALPLVLGRLADAFGIRSAYGVVAVLLVAVFLIILFTGRRLPLHQPIME